MFSMIRNAIPDAIALKAGNAALKASQNSPHILFGVGIAGFVGTVVLASRATLQVDEVLEKAETDRNNADRLFAENNEIKERGETPKYQYDEQDYMRDKVYIYVQTTIALGKLYAPAIIVGSVSILCLTKSHQILTSRNTALTAAYAALQKSYTEYRKRVRKEIGEDKERDLYFDAVYEEIENSEGTKETVKKIGPNAYSPYAKFFDELCPNWEKVPEYNYLFLRAQQNYANDKLRSRGHLFLNEVYDMLGLEHTYQGQVVGWVLNGDGDNYVDFGFMDRDKRGARDFVNGREGAILLDFNVDGVIMDKVPSFRRKP